MKKIFIFVTFFVLLMAEARQVSSIKEYHSSNLNQGISRLESMMSINTKKSLAGTFLLGLVFGVEKVHSVKLKKIIEQLNLWTLFILNPLHLFLFIELVPLTSTKSKKIIHIFSSAILFLVFRHYQFALNFIYNSIQVLFKKANLEVKNEISFLITYFLIIVLGIFNKSPYTFSISFGIWGCFIFFKNEPKRFQFLLLSLVIIITKYFFDDSFSILSVCISLSILFFYKKMYKLFLPLCVYCLITSQNKLILKLINFLISFLSHLAETSNFFSSDSYFIVIVIIFWCLYKRKFSYFFLVLILNVDLVRAPTIIFSK
jgi:hypothetical protein